MKISRPSRPVPPATASSRSAEEFARIYTAHHASLHRYCSGILRGEHDAQDALQNTAAKAFVAWQGGAEVREPRAWLFRIAHNEAISLMRSRRAADLVANVPEQPGEGLTDVVERRELLAHLERDLAALPEKQRYALLLRELNGLGHEEIAEVLGSTPRAIKQTIYEARVGLLDADEGRAMTCASVRQVLSDGDGRAKRGRRMRGHLRSCRQCRSFAAALEHRPGELAALVPAVPAVSAAAVIAHLLGPAGGGAVAAGGAALVGGGAATGAAAGGAGSSAAAGSAVVGSATSAAAATGSAGLAGSSVGTAATGALVSTKAAVAVVAALAAVGGGVAVERQTRHTQTAPARKGQQTTVTHGRPAAPPVAGTVPASPSAQPGVAGTAQGAGATARRAALEARRARSAARKAARTAGGALASGHTTTAPGAASGSASGSPHEAKTPKATKKYPAPPATAKRPPTTSSGRDSSTTAKPSRAHKATKTTSQAPATPPARRDPGTSTATEPAPAPLSDDSGN